MRIKSSWIKMITLPLALASLFACGGVNGDAPPMIDASGKHAENWVQQHWVVYKKANGGSGAASGMTECSECHGTDLGGGISKVSCFTASFDGTSCHPNADRKLGHATGWGDHVSTGFHGYSSAGLRGNTDLARDCGLCHATGPAETSVSTAPSCLSTDPRWGISCHVSSPAQTPSGCGSCHQIPSKDSSSSTGAHLKHLNLPGGLSCSACHADVSGVSVTHATGASAVSPASLYKAPSGNASYSDTDGTCINVSCHGGKLTPSWADGAIAVETECLSCHQQGVAFQTPQYNSFFSGNIIDGKNGHAEHLARNIACSVCHSVDKTQHFGSLADPGFSAANTIVQGAEIGSYTAGVCNNVSCHSGGGAPISVRWDKQ